MGIKYYYYKFKKEDKDEKSEEEEKKEKENITYNENYQKEILERKNDLCEYIKAITKEEFENSFIIKGLKDIYKIKKDVIFDLLCFSCDDKIKTYEELKSHTTKNHNIFIDMNELMIVCMECKRKFNLALIKDKLTIEQKTYIQSIIERFPICPKFLTPEEIYEIKYNRLVKDFSSGKYKNIIFLSRLISGTYPVSSNIIPTDYSIDIECNYNDLYDMIDRASLLTSDKDKNTIKLTLMNRELIISSNSPEIGKVEEKIIIDNDGEISISFSSKYMLDAIKSFSSEKIHILMNDDNSPIIVKSDDENTLVQLVLPIKTY